MNEQFLVAGMLSSLACLANGFWAELTILKRLQETSMPQTGRVALRGVWHLLTVALLWSAVTLFVLSFSDFVEHPNTVAKFISVSFFGFALVWSFLVAIERLNYLVLLPQWVVAVAIAAVTWWGAV
jgi:FtsH-binding integral membrane protein